MNKWILVGHLGTGDAIYWQRGGALAIEKDHERLVEPTPEEKAEIYKTMSHLKPAKETRRRQFQEIESEEAEEARL